MVYRCPECQFEVFEPYKCLCGWELPDSCQKCITHPERADAEGNSL
eukprot:g12722.t1